jgi:hypothetical protein
MSWPCANAGNLNQKELAARRACSIATLLATATPMGVDRYAFIDTTRNYWRNKSKKKK